MGAENALYTILIKKINMGALVLPTLPEIALKVREAADDPNVNLGQMGGIINHDPALSLGIIKVANSALLGRIIKVETVHQAVTRIGLRQIKSIATAMAIEQIFVSKNKIVSMYMKKSWEKTVNIASVAISLMTFYLKEHKHTLLTIDNVTLAALIHSIGVLPILTEAEGHPEVFSNPTFLQQTMNKLSNVIGVEVIRSWGFSDEFVELVGGWSDLTLLPQEPNYLDFIRAGAIYNNIFKNEATCDILLKSYVSKGILPSADFMQTEEFTEMLSNVKSMFS